MTSQSLLIIDEFGKGTDGLDGAALFASLVEHITGVLPGGDTSRPRALLATHFHEVVESDLLNRSANLKLQHMQILLPSTTTDAIQDCEGSRSVETGLTYLYTLADGPSHGSFGLNCAMIGGVQPEVLARAAQLLTITSRGDSLVHALSHLMPAEKADLHHADEVAKAFLRWDLSTESVSGIREKLQAVLAA
jgi:DNA mismatch repair protein MSH5